jgi:hypothetical protein
MTTYKFVFLDKFFPAIVAVPWELVIYDELIETEVPGENYKPDSSTNFIKNYCIKFTDYW